MNTEVRLDRLRPAEIDAAIERAAVAWIPLGALEFHAPHLPNGTDGITAQGVLVQAAARLGGVVLPWSYITVSTLALPWSFRFDPVVVAETLRQTLRQLPAFGVRVAVVHTGHGPLDLNHLVKRVCAEVEAEGIGLRAIGLCYLELNAALGTGLDSEWPVAVDHGSTMETSWIAALDPDLVALERLPVDRDAPLVGVYGPNPRFTADADLGARQIGAAAELLTERVSALLAGSTHDPMGDLRTFVTRYWPEPLIIKGRAGRPDSTDGAAAVVLTNPAPVSRYLSSVSLMLDGLTLAPESMVLVNRATGETGAPVVAADLGPEYGFYVRRGQSADLRLPVDVAPGVHDIELRLGLAGVTEVTRRERVEFR